MIQTNNYIYYIIEIDNKKHFNNNYIIFKYLYLSSCESLPSKPPQ